MLAVAALVACSSGDEPASGADVPAETTDIGVQLSWYLNAQFGGFVVADANGYWEESGLNVELVPGVPNAINGIQAIEGGSAQMAVINEMSTVATAIGAGADLVVVGATWQSNPGTLMSFADTPINSLADLEGLRVGTTAPRGELIRTSMNNAGADGSLMELVITSDTSALIEGEVDVLGGFINNQALVLQHMGYELSLFTNEEVGMHDYGDYIVTSRSFLEDNRDAVVAFMAGLVAGWNDYVADTDAAADLIMDVSGEELGLDSEILILQTEGFAELIQSDYTASNGLLAVDLDRIIGEVYEATMSVYGLTDLPDPASFIDVTVLEDAAS